VALLLHNIIQNVRLLDDQAQRLNGRLNVFRKAGHHEPGVFFAGVRLVICTMVEQIIDDAFWLLTQIIYVKQHMFYKMCGAIVLNFFIFDTVVDKYSDRDRTAVSE